MWSSLFGLNRMLKVIKAQGQALVSDSGRWGYQHQGVPVDGVLDSFSFSVGNRALGNLDNAACLELMGKFVFVSTQPGKVFMANRGAQGVLNGKRVHCGQVLHLQEGDVLAIEPPCLGLWTMLCVQGGIDVPIVMGSRSTCLAAGFGGLQGRVLQVGDCLQAGDEFQPALREDIRLAMPLATFDSSGALTVNCLPGPEFGELTDHSRQLFEEQLYTLGQQSSRMGYVLKGTKEPLKLSGTVSMRSHAVHPGVVQLPPSGQPVVLLCEAQVTGGYPRLASVLSSELGKFAQLRPGQGVHLVVVDAAQATRLQLRHSTELRRYHHVIESNRGESHVD